MGIHIPTGRGNLWGCPTHSKAFGIATAKKDLSIVNNGMLRKGII